MGLASFNLMRKRQAEQATAQAESTDISELSIKEIKSLLDEVGADYLKSARKDDLISLYNQSIAEKA